MLCLQREQNVSRAVEAALVLDVCLQVQYKLQATCVLAVLKGADQNPVATPHLCCRLQNHGYIMESCILDSNMVLMAENCLPGT